MHCFWNLENVYSETNEKDKESQFVVVYMLCSIYANCYSTIVNFIRIVAFVIFITLYDPQRNSLKRLSAYVYFYRNNFDGNLIAF